MPVLLLFFAENNSGTEKSHNRSRGGHADKVIGAGGGVLGRFGSRGGSVVIVGVNDSDEFWNDLTIRIELQAIFEVLFSIVFILKCPGLYFV